MKSNNNHNGSNEYEKAINFLEKGCNCGCSSVVPKEEFAELRESFQALSKPEQDIFLMAQLKAMDGGLTSTSRRLKKRTRSNKKTFYHWDHNTPLCQETYLNMLGIGRTYFENIRSHLINNVLLTRGKGFQYLDIKAILGIYFKKLPSIQKYQHFLFEASNFGVVKAQEIANGPFTEFNLLKTKEENIFEEIRVLSILVLTSPPLDYKRQEYLYNNIRPFVKDEYKDVTCQRSFYTSNK